jgi:hypothetical protein
MAKIPVRPPNTPREVKAARSAIHRLDQSAAKINRDIMNRKVDNLSEARRIAANKRAKSTELKLDLINSPAMKKSTRNKYHSYRMPTKVRSARRRPRRRAPLKRSIQASIRASNNRLVQSRTAKPFTVAKPSPKAPQIKRAIRRVPRRGYVRRVPQSPVRSAKNIVSRPNRMSRMFKRMARRSPSRRQRTALNQEALVQSRNAKVAKSQLDKNRLQQQNSRIARMRQRYLQQQKQRRYTKRVSPDPRDARRISKRAISRQTYVIKGQKVSKPVYDRYMSQRKAIRDRQRALMRTKPRKTSRRSAPVKINRPRSRAMNLQNQQRQGQSIDRMKANAAQRSMIERNLQRRRVAQARSNNIAQQRLRMLKENMTRSRSSAVMQAKQIEEHLAKLKAKQTSVQSRLSPIQERIRSFRSMRRLGEANLGAIRRDDNLADNHRYNMQELSKLENEASALGAVSRKLKQQEMNLQSELQVVSDQIGNLNPSRLYNENKENLSQTKSLEKCLGDKLQALNQTGHVSGDGINKAKAIIRQFDKRQIPFDEAKTRIYRTLKQAHTPKGGDMLKRDVAGIQEEINGYEMYSLASQGMEFSAAGKEELRKLVNKYAVGQIKTRNEAEAQFMQIVGNPRFVQKKVTIAELGHARALGIAATIRSRKSKQLPGVRQLTTERRAFYDKQRIAEEERLKKSQERVEAQQSLAGIFPRTRSAMERMSR